MAVLLPIFFDGGNAEPGSSNPVTKPKPRAWEIYMLELLKEPDVGGNAETGSSNPVTKPKPRA